MLAILFLRRLFSSNAGEMGTVTFLTSIGIQALGVTTGIVVARSLGPLDRGHVALILLIPLILGYVGDFGVDRAATYFSARNEEDHGTIASSLLLIAALETVPATGIAIALSMLVLQGQTSDIRQVGLIATVIVPLSILSRFGQSQLQGRMKIRQLSISRSIEPLGYLFLLFSFATVAQLSVTTVVAAKLLAQTGVIGLSWGWVIADVSLKKPEFQLVRSLLSYGARGYLTKLSPTDSLQLDQWVVGLTLGARELAFYVVGLSILGPARIVPTSVNMLVFPMLAQGNGKDPDVRWLARVGVGLSLTIALALTLSVEHAIPILFGDEFRPAIGPARILALGSAFLAIRELMVAALYGHGKPKWASEVQLVSTSALIPSLFILPPILGVNGAAIAVVLSYVAGTIHAFHRSRGHRW